MACDVLGKVKLHKMEQGRVLNKLGRLYRSDGKLMKAYESYEHAVVALRAFEQMPRPIPRGYTAQMLVMHKQKEQKKWTHLQVRQERMCAWVGSHATCMCEVVFL